MGNGVVFEAPSSPDFLQQQSFHLLKSDVALVALSFCVLATQYQPSSLFWIIFLNADRLMDTQKHQVDCQDFKCYVSMEFPDL